MKNKLIGAFMGVATVFGTTNNAMADNNDSELTIVEETSKKYMGFDSPDIKLSDGSTLICMDGHLLAVIDKNDAAAKPEDITQAHRDFCKPEGP